MKSKRRVEAYKYCANCLHDLLINKTKRKENLMITEVKLHFVVDNQYSELIFHPIAQLISIKYNLILDTLPIESFEGYYSFS